MSLDSTDTVVTNLEAAGKKVVITPNIGFGFNFFLNQTMAPSWTPGATRPLPLSISSTTRMSQRRNQATVQANNLVASVGLSFIIPR